MSLHDLYARTLRRRALVRLALTCLAAVVLVALATHGPADAAIGGW